MDITNFTLNEVKLHDEITNYLNDRERKDNYSFNLMEDGCNTVINLIEKYNRLASKMDETVNQLEELAKNPCGTSKYCKHAYDGFLNEHGCEHCVAYQAIEIVKGGKNCTNLYNLSDENDVEIERECGNYNCMTQADRIRSMSDEELAEWFSTVTDDVLRGSTWSKDGWMKYLQSEVE